MPDAIHRKRIETKFSGHGILPFRAIILVRLTNISQLSNIMATGIPMSARKTSPTPVIGAWRMSTRERSGVYQTGRDRVMQLLETALEIVLEDGYQALTLREVARRCNVRIGAVSHYYKSRNDLLQDVLNMVLVPYAEKFKAIELAPGKSAEQKLEQLIRVLLDDIQTRKTTRLFPHLWVLANHDEFVARAVDSIYILERITLARLIAEINPALNEQECETLAVFVSGSIAGSTMFVGFEKPWANELPLFSAIACRGLIDLVKTVTSEQLAAYGWHRTRKAKWTYPTILPKPEYNALVKGVRAGSAAEETRRYRALRG
jgi:AcrR family transcriptional regulator